MRGPFLILLAAGCGVWPAAAQKRASLGIGVGTVRYPGGTSFSSAAFSPTIGFSSPTLDADGSASFASLPNGVWSSQGRGDVWVTSPPLYRGWRFGAEGIVAGTARSDGGRTAAAQGVGELLWSAPRWGFGIGAGPSGGRSVDQSSVTAWRTRARGWWHLTGDEGDTDWQVTVEPTRFPRITVDSTVVPAGWFTDATVGATLTRGRAVASLAAVARISGAYGSKGAGSIFLQFYVAPRVALEVAGGSYLDDPYQGLPRAGFVTLGVRLHATARASSADPKGPKWSPLVPERRGDSLVVRFQFDSARSVAIAGDWNQWAQLPLRSLGAGLWEGTLALRHGLYHFNVLVDGTDWVVPNGVATVPDGLGGMVAVLVVP